MVLGRRYWGQERMFQRGEFKYLILDLLKDRPRHGYELIQELGERFHGFYAPSPGIVYPTLQYFEEMGYVTSKEQDGKRVYTITAKGLKFLEDQSEMVRNIKCHRQSPWRSDLRDQFFTLMGDIHRLGRVIVRRSRSINGEKIDRIGDVLKKATREIEEILREESET